MSGWGGKWSSRMTCVVLVAQMIFQAFQPYGVQAASPARLDLSSYESRPVDVATGGFVSRSPFTSQAKGPHASAASTTEPPDNPMNSRTITATTHRLFLPVAVHHSDQRSVIVVRNVLENDRVLNGQTVTATLLLQMTPAAPEALPPISGMTITVRLPEGLAYVAPADSASMSPHIDANNRRELVFRDVGIGSNGQAAFIYRLAVTGNPSDPPANRAITASVGMPPSMVGNYAFTVEPTLVRFGRALSPVAIGVSGGSYELLDSRVVLTVPAGAFTETVSVSGVEYAPITSTGVSSQAIAFDLYPDLVARAPITLRVNLAGLVNPSALTENEWPGLRFMYQETITRSTLMTGTLSPRVNGATWRRSDVASEYDPATGWLTAQLTHFSSYEAGVQRNEPKPWTLNPNLGDVSLFRGSAEFEYPLTVPPMHDGLQPRLVLQYSSAGADQGAEDANSLGPGWSLDLPKITRLVKQELVAYSYYEDYPDRVPCPDDPSQTCVNGYADGNGNFHPVCDQYHPPQNGWCRWWYTGYRAEGYYRNDFTLSFGGADYSLIHKGNGEYVTEQFTPFRIRRCSRDSSLFACDGYARLPDGYVRNEGGEYWQVWTTDGTRYVFGASPQSEQMFAASYMPAIANTEAYAGSLTNRVAQAWHLEVVYAARRDHPSSNAAQNRWSARYYYSERTTGGADVESRLDWITYGNFATAGIPQHQVYFDYVDRLGEWQPYRIRLLVSSQLIRRYEFAYAGSLLSSVSDQVWNGQAYVNLPAMAFEYATYDGRSLLARVRNGYGGVQAFAYGGNTTGHFVLTRTTTSGLGWTDVEGYRYSQACYNHDGQPCRTGHDWRPSGALVGFAQVTRTVGLTNTVLSASAHRFHIDRPRVGREYETRSLNTALTATLELETTAYRVFSSDVGLPAGAWFAAPVTVTQYPNSGDGYATDAYKRTVNIYDTALQGGMFLGQVTSQHDFDSGRLIRSRHTHYAVNADRWVIKPISETVTGPSGEPVSDLRYYYDRLPVASATKVITGDLTFVQAVGIVDGAERTRDVSIEYDVLGNKVSETVFSDYGWVGQIASPADRPSSTDRFDYDRQYGLFPVTWTNALGHVTRVDYYGVDGMPFLTTTLDSGEVARLFSSFGLVAREVGPNGEPSATAYGYDVFGRLTRIARPGDALTLPTVQYVYGDAPDGLNAVATNSGIAITTRQRPLRALPSTNDSAEVFDGLGRVVQTRARLDDGRLVASHTAYDPAGRVAMGSEPILATGPLTSLNVIDWGMVPSTTTTFDDLGRARVTTGPDGTVTRRSYDRFCVATLDANQHLRLDLSDAFGRLMAVREYTGTYAAPICQSPTLPIAYATTQYVHDAADRLVSVVEPLGHRSVITYNAFGDKMAMDDPDMGQWRYAYDARGQLITQTDALSQSLVFQHDDLGRVTGKWVLKATASALVPLAAYRYDEGGAAAFALGQRTSVSDATGRTQWAYDERGRTVRETRTITLAMDSGAAGCLNGSPPGCAGFGTFAVERGYDNLDRPVRLTYPDGEVVTTTYGVQGPLALETSQALGNGQRLIVGGAQYNVPGQLASLRIGNGLTTRYAYYGYNAFRSVLGDASGFSPGDAGRVNFGRLAWTCTLRDDVQNVLGTCGDPSRNLAQSARLSYDLAGNVTTLADYASPTGPQLDATALQEQQFSYDDLDRLTAAMTSTPPGASPQSWQYDASGNIVSRRGALSFERFSLHPTKPHAAIAAYEEPTHTLNFSATYDANGNMTSRMALSGTQPVRYGYRWDAENRLIGVVLNEDAATTEERFFYSAEGERVARMTRDGTTIYIDELYEEWWPGRRPPVDVTPTVPNLPQSPAAPAGIGAGIVYADDFTVNASREWTAHLLPPATCIDGALGRPAVDWSLNGQLRLYIVPGTSALCANYFSSSYPLVGHNQAFTPTGMRDGSFYVSLALRYSSSYVYPSYAGIGSTDFASRATTPGDVLHVEQNGTSPTRRFFVRAFGRTVVSVPVWPANTPVVIALAVRNGRFGLWRDGQLVATDTAPNLVPRSVWIGASEVVTPGSWPDTLVDRVEAGEPESSPPVLQLMSPLTWTRENPVIGVMVQDSGAGLLHGSMQFCVLPVGASSCANWTAIAENFVNGETVARSVSFSLGAVAQGRNRLMVRVSDVLGNVTTQTFDIWVDSLPPALSQAQQSSLYLSPNGDGRYDRITVTMGVSDTSPVTWQPVVWSATPGPAVRVFGPRTLIPIAHTWAGYTGTDASNQCCAADGRYWLTVTVTDSVGLTSKRGFFVIVDRTPPRTTDANLIVLPNGRTDLIDWPANVTPTVSADNLALIRGLIDPNIDLGFTPGASVTVRVNGQPAMLGWIRSGAWGYSRTVALLPGHNAITVSLTDLAGNVAVLTRTLIYTATGPALADYAPKSVVTRSGMVTVTSRISAGVEVANLITVTLQDGGVQYSAVAVRNGLLLTATLGPVPAGNGRPLVASVWLRPVGGAQSHAFTWPFRIDSQAQATIVLPTSPTINASPIDIVVQGDTDNDGNGKAQVWLNGVSLGERPTDGFASARWADIDVVTGSLTLTVRLTDAYGNVGAAAGTYQVDFSQPIARVTGAPLVIASGTSSSQQIAYLHLSGSAPNQPDWAISTWRLTLTPRTPISASERRVWSGVGPLSRTVMWDGRAASGIIRDGVYDAQLVVTATNGVVTRTGSSGALAISVDRTFPPAPVIMFPRGVLTHGLVVMTGTAVTGSTVVPYRNGARLANAATVQAGVWVLPDTQLLPGVNVFTATAQGANGLWSLPSLPVSATLWYEPPLFMAALAPSRVLPNAAITATALARGSGGPLPPTRRVTVQPQNETLLLSSIVTNGLTGTWRLATTADARWCGGVYCAVEALFTAVDTEGFYGTGYATLIVDGVRPSPPMIDYPSWLDPAPRNAPTITVIGRAGGLLRVELSGPGGVVTTTANANGYFQAVMPLATGLNTICGVTVNDLGTRSERSDRCGLAILDNAPPSVTEVQPQFIRPNQWYRIAAAVADLSPIVLVTASTTLTDPNEARMFILRPQNGGSSLFASGLAQARHEAWHTATVRAEDLLGNVAVTRTPFVVDGTPPRITVTQVVSQRPWTWTISPTLVFYGVYSYATTAGITTVVRATDALVGVSSVTYTQGMGGAVLGIQPAQGLRDVTLSRYQPITGGVWNNADLVAQAVDRSGNQATAAVAVRQDATPPDLSVTVASRSTDGTARVIWIATDTAALNSGLPVVPVYPGGAGVRGYDLSVVVNGLTETRLLTNTALTAFDARGLQPGNVYEWRVRATDNVNNSRVVQATTVAVLATKTYYFGARRVAVRSSMVDGRSSLSWLQMDHLSSVTAMTDEQGNVTARQSFAPYGEERTSYSSLSLLPSALPWGWATHREGEAGGLVYMGARWYLPGIGRFIQPDIVVPKPDEPRAFNRYAYAEGNPLRFIDPDGHDPCVSAPCQPFPADNVLTVDEGYGNVYVREYEVRITKPSMSERQALQDFKEHFAEFMPSSAKFTPNAGKDGMLNEGDMMDIVQYVPYVDGLVKIPMIRTGVYVLEATQHSSGNSFTLVTAKDHVEAGAIRFTVSEQTGALVFNITSEARGATEAWNLAYELGGRKQQNNTWTTVLNNAVKRYATPQSQVTARFATTVLSKPTHRVAPIRRRLQGVYIAQ